VKDLVHLGPDRQCHAHRSHGYHHHRGHDRCGQHHGLHDPQPKL
jgi:hypothetical protein